MKCEELGPTSNERAEEAILAGIRVLLGVAARSIAAIADDVSLPQYRILVIIDRRGPQIMGALAERLNLDPSTVTRVCDRLVDKKLISRSVDANDRRAVLVHLTARSRRLIGQVNRLRRDDIHRLLESLSVDAQQRLAASLGELASAAGELADAAWTLGWAE